jgi:hypothetical protein
MTMTFGLTGVRISVGLGCGELSQAGLPDPTRDIFVSVHSKGVKRRNFVSAYSKAVDDAECVNMECKGIKCAEDTVRNKPGTFEGPGSIVLAETASATTATSTTSARGGNELVD